MNKIKTKNHITDFIAAIIFTIVLILFIIKALSFPLSDFANYYFGSKFFWQGKPLTEIYEGYRFNQFIAEAGYNNIFVNYTPSPPVLILFFSPFVIFKAGIAKIIFNSLSAIILIFTLTRVFKTKSIDLKYIVLFPVVFFIPLLNNFLFGQVYVLLLSLILLGYISYEKNNKILAAVLWAIAIMSKIFPAVIILFLIFKKDWRQLVYTLAACTIFLIISILMVGTSIWFEYVFHILPRLLNGEFHNTFTPVFQSMSVFLKNIFVSDAIFNPSPVFDNQTIFIILFSLFKAVVIASGVYLTINSKSKDFIKFASWFVISLLIAPYGSTYGLLMLSIFLIAYFKQDQSDSNRFILIGVLIFFISNVPIQKFLIFDFWFQFPRLYLLLSLAIVIVYFFNAKINLAVFLILFLIFLFTAKNKNQGISYYSPQIKELMVYDYSVNNNKLIYTFWNDKGANTKTIQISDSIRANSEIELKNNQVYFKSHKITNTSDRKLKPMQLNENSIILLSDANRGVGFYTLQKVQFPVEVK